MAQAGAADHVWKGKLCYICFNLCSGKPCGILSHLEEGLGGGGAGISSECQFKLAFSSCCLSPTWSRAFRRSLIFFGSPHTSTALMSGPEYCTVELPRAEAWELATPSPLEGWGTQENLFGSLHSSLSLEGGSHLSRAVSLPLLWCGLALFKMVSRLVCPRSCCPSLAAWRDYIPFWLEKYAGNIPETLSR